MFGIPNQWVIVGVVMLTAFGLWKAYDAGFDTANAQCEAKIAELKLKIENENNARIAEMMEELEQSKNQQRELMKELGEQDAELEKLLKDNENEANLDPNADECGIGSDSVLRLNRIK